MVYYPHLIIFKLTIPVGPKSKVFSKLSEQISTSSFSSPYSGPQTGSTHTNSTTSTHITSTSEPAPSTTSSTGSPKSSVLSHSVHSSIGPDSPAVVAVSWAGASSSS